MHTRRLVAIAALATAACNVERKQECDALLGAMKPIDDPAPTAPNVDRVLGNVGRLDLHDQPLRVYEENFTRTLTVLKATLELRAGPSPPDGTDDVIKSQTKEARTDVSDVARYCAQ